MRTTHIFNKTTNINLINQIHNQFNNHLSSLSTFNHLLLLLQLISTSSPLITTITQPSKQQPLIYGYFNNSSLIDSLFSTNITVIFFFQKFSTPIPNLFQQKTTNQSINQLIPFSNISLSKKKGANATTTFTQNSHTLLTQTLICYGLLIINTITQEVVMFLNNTLQLCFHFTTTFTCSTKTKTNNIT